MVIIGSAEEMEERCKYLHMWLEVATYAMSVSAIKLSIS